MMVMREKMKVIYGVTLHALLQYRRHVCLLGTLFLLLLSEIHNVEACYKFFFMGMSLHTSTMHILEESAL